MGLPVRAAAGRAADNGGVRTKSVVAVAVERRGSGKPGVPGDRSSPLGWKRGRKPIPGFAALQVVSDAATETLEKFLADKVKAGSHILSDGWPGYRRLKRKGFEHTATALSRQDEPAHCLFP
jgi:hypothetical protein